MGCESCGTKPNGCKSNGGCSTGSCNRLNVHDWLMNLPMGDGESTCKIVELSFKNGSRKDFFRNNSLQIFEKGDYVTIEGVGGFDVGEVSLNGELVRVQMKKKGVKEFSPDIKKILRRSSDRDLDLFHQSKAREQNILMRAREVARDLKLAMKLSEVEIQADGKKATFFYTADDRVDFREMIKSYASEFKVKVEMRQIGIRQEAGKVGGIGSCGRELCCSTWLTDFKSVNTTAARYQNLSINQTKLSGQCGRLKCCLNFELDTYLDALQHFPNNADKLEIQRGRAMLVKKDIFKDLMWYTLPDSNKQYPLTLKRVQEILKLNAQGEKPDNLEAVELLSKNQEIEPSFVDVVGQISLRSLERNDKKRKNRNRNDRNGSSGGNGDQGRSNARTSPNGGPGQGGGNQRPGGNRHPESRSGEQPEHSRRAPKNRNPNNPNNSNNPGNPNNPNNPNNQNNPRGQNAGPGNRNNNPRQQGRGGQSDANRGQGAGGPLNNDNRKQKPQRDPRGRSGGRPSPDQSPDSERSSS